MILLKRFVRAHAPRGVQHFCRKLYYPWVLRRFSDADWPPAAVIRRLVQSGDHVVDVGANVGYVTLLLSRWVGPAGCVYSFEPIPETFGLLRHNVRRLRLNNVVLFECAASDRAGTAEMEVPMYPEGGWNWYESRVVGPGEAPRGLRRSVRLCRLDDVVPSTRVSFVKIDVEGHEARALAGAMELIRRSRPALLIEMCCGRDEARSIQLLLESEGYRVWPGSDGPAAPALETRSAGDVLFLRPEHVLKFHGP